MIGKNKTNLYVIQAIKKATYNKWPSYQSYCDVVKKKFKPHRLIRFPTTALSVSGQGSKL